MRAHIIEGGVVANTIEVESLDFLPNLIEATHGGTGWLWDGEVLTPPLPAAPTRDTLKAERQAKVDAITVTTAAGNTFDGDEVSQERMNRAITVLNASPLGTTVTWVLHDNSVAEVTAGELLEALALAGTAQAAIWVI